jgi:LmbE family N-acetylglucosaminyl deacetylase
VSGPPAVEGRSVAELGTILGVWAHPDDEVYLSGGVMAVARDAGQRVSVVTATRGEHGQAGSGQLTSSELGRLREEELRTAFAILGVDDHRFLGVEDGRCAEQPVQPMVQLLTEIIEQVAPTTILTFGPDGMTGHEDHQVVSSWVTSARSRAAPGADLLYATTTAAHADEWQDLHDAYDIYLAPGLPMRRRPEELAFELRLDERLSRRKFDALRAMESQTSELIAAVGAHTFRAWCAVESFVAADTVPARAWSTWKLTRPNPAPTASGSMSENGLDDVPGC